jgi:hypothetical protein
MRNLQVEFIRLEVKYCENCGGLWCRKMGDSRIHCSTCRSQILSSDSRSYDARQKRMMRAQTGKHRIQ